MKLSGLASGVRSVLFVLMVSVLMAVVPPSVYAVPAFPEAEGFGAQSAGGRGGTVYEVTNTADSGTGSLRACVAASGPRICVFKVGGLITLNSPLTISNPFITIAGQTAPGGGITLKLGSSTEIFLTETHDVVIRYITARAGPGGENHNNQMAKNGTEIYNIMIDHNSLSWGVDSNIETWYRVKNATVQWSLISEGLSNSTHAKGEHSKGIMIGGYAGSESHSSLGSENISVLNNLMAQNLDRNPLIQMCGIGQVMNNVSYNPGYDFSQQQLNCTGSGYSGTSYVNWINNYHKKGPMGSYPDLRVIPSDDGACSSGKVYVSGNIGPNRLSTSDPEENWVAFKSPCTKANILVTAPAAAPAVATTNAADAYAKTLADGGAGNSRVLNCDGTWSNRRDSIDTRVLNDVVNGTGKIIDNPSQVGGWITPATGSGCTDSDHDGMPDSWEQARGLNPAANDGTADRNGDGYTNLEEYLNGNGVGPPIPTSTPGSGGATDTQAPTVPPVPTPTQRPASSRTPTKTPAPSRTPTSTATPYPTPTPTPAFRVGDADGNGVVNDADYSYLSVHFGQHITGGRTAGDFDFNGIVDGKDYALWVMNFDL